MRHITRPEQDQHVAEMIAAIKDTSERELHRYKVEAEATFTRNVSTCQKHVNINVFDEMLQCLLGMSDWSNT